MSDPSSKNIRLSWEQWEQIETRVGPEGIRIDSLRPVGDTHGAGYRLLTGEKNAGEIIQRIYKSINDVRGVIYVSFYNPAVNVMMPGIVSFTQEPDGSCFLMMRQPEGERLDQIIIRFQAGLPELTLFRIILGIVRILHACYEAGWEYPNISPENIIWNEANKFIALGEWEKLEAVPAQKESTRKILKNVPGVRECILKCIPGGFVQEATYKLGDLPGYPPIAIELLNTLLKGEITFVNAKSYLAGYLEARLFELDDRWNRAVTDMIKNINFATDLDEIGTCWAKLMPLVLLDQKLCPEELNQAIWYRIRREQISDRLIFARQLCALIWEMARQVGWKSLEKQIEVVDNFLVIQQSERNRLGDAQVSLVYEIFDRLFQVEPDPDRMIEVYRLFRENRGMVDSQRDGLEEALKDWAKVGLNGRAADVVKSFEKLSIYAVNDLISKGRKAYLDGDYEVAIQHFEKILQAQPENVIARKYLKDAKNDLENEIIPPKKLTLELLQIFYHARYLRLIGNFEEARVELERARSMANNSGIGYAWKAWENELDLWKKESALDLQKQAIKELIEHEQFEEAFFRLKSMPSDSLQAPDQEYFAALGDLQLLRKNLAEIESSLVEGVEARMRKLQQMREQLSRVATLWPDISWLPHAAVQITTQEDDLVYKAKQDIRHALHSIKADVPPRQGQHIVSRHMGQIEMLLQLRPDDLELQTLSGYARHLKFKVERVISSFEKAADCLQVPVLHETLEAKHILMTLKPYQHDEEYIALCQNLSKRLFLLAGDALNENRLEEANLFIEHYEQIPVIAGDPHLKKVTQRIKRYRLGSRLKHGLIWGVSTSLAVAALVSALAILRGW